MTPGFAKPRSELPWLPYKEHDRVIINSHNFGSRYPTLQDAVAGYYARLDTGSAATDRFTSDGSQDGTLTNGATRVDDGGLAYSCDGVNDYITAGTTSALHLAASSFSLSCWVKFSNTGVVSDIISRANAGLNCDYSLRRLASNKLRVYAASNSETRLDYYDSVTTFVSGAAAIVTCTYNKPARTWKMYVNGVEEGQSTVSSGAAIGTGDNGYQFTIASQPVIPPRYAAIKIDDILVYARTLTAAEAGYLASQRGSVYL